jgi:transposase
MNQVTVFSGAQRQRRWSEGEKRAMVEAAFAQGAIVSVVAQRFDVAASQLIGGAGSLVSWIGRPVFVISRPWLSARMPYRPWRAPHCRGCQFP